MVEIHREDAILPAVGPNQRLREHDRLIFAGIVDSIVDIQHIQGLEPATDQIFKIETPRRNRVLIEAVVSASHPLRGSSIKEGEFRNRYNAVVLAVSRSGERLKQKVGDIILQTGDTLLIEGTSSFLTRFKNSNQYYLVSPLEGAPVSNFGKSGLALIILLRMIVLAGVGILSMFQAVILACGCMIVGRVINYSTGIEAIDWKVIIAIGCSLGIGSALKTTGVAELIAVNVLELASSNLIVTLIITYFMTWILTELITNNAAMFWYFPLHFRLLNPWELILCLAIVIIMSRSASFSTPLGYQTNLMIYGPGSYKYSDYLKIGIPLNYCCHNHLIFSRIILGPLLENI